MENRKKIFTVVLVVLVLVFGALSVYAYTGNYSFNILSAVYGTNVHTLANQSTSTTVSAQTWNFDYNQVVSPKATYTVELYKSWLTNYSTPQITADGNSYTKSFGVVASGNYTINVYKNTGESTYRAVGNGTINQ